MPGIVQREFVFDGQQVPRRVDVQVGILEMLVPAYEGDARPSDATSTPQSMYP
jgi:hypothetical protein